MTSRELNLGSVCGFTDEPETNSVDEDWETFGTDTQTHTQKPEEDDWVLVDSENKTITQSTTVRFNFSVENDLFEDHFTAKTVEEDEDDPQLLGFFNQHDHVDVKVIKD